MSRISSADEARFISLMAQGQLPFQPSQINATATSESSSISKVGARIPQLDEPGKLSPQDTQKAMNELVDMFTDDEGNILDPENLLIIAIQQITSLTTSHLQLKQNIVTNERNFLMAEEARRTSANEAYYASINNSSSVNKVTKALTSFGLMASGVASLAAGFSAVSFGAIVVGGCLLLDQILDDKAKTLVASWIARGDHEIEQKWVERIHIAFAVTSAALSFGLSKDKAIEIGKGIATAAVTGTKGIVDYKLGNHKALMTELEEACRDNQKSFDGLLTELQDLCDAIHQYYDDLHHIEEMRMKLSHLMTKFTEYV